MLKNHEHTSEAIAKRLAKDPRRSYLRDWIYGAIDGVVTTFAVISGVLGGNLSDLVILILGFANLFADGFSMAASNYLGTKSELDLQRHYETIEERHIRLFPNGETQEIRQILINKGVSGDDLEKMVEVITSNKSLWIDTMLQEEYGVTRYVRSPIIAALSTFAAFVICGFVPLIPYTFSLPHEFIFSVILTALIFFVIGSMKSKWSLQAWWVSGLLTLLIGSAAALLAYIVGFLIHFYFHQ